MNELTKLEYFSAMAMQGMLANSYDDKLLKVLSHASAKEIADMSVNCAIELIKRIKEEEK